MAVQVSTRSTCSRKSVGAILVTQGNIAIISGYNGAPRGMPHCIHDGTETHCENTVHAEANAISAAAWVGSRTYGTTCYTTLSPCVDCAGLLINAGINRVVFGEPYRNLLGTDRLKLAGVKVEWHGTIVNWS
jgi:dCMP deaminase